MNKLLFTLIVIFIKVINSEDIYSDLTNMKNIATIKPGKSEYISLNYTEEYFFNFNNTEMSRLQINIHSINCNIDVEPKEKIEDSVNLNIYSIIITDNSTISIKPIMDIVDGRHKENYKAKECPIIINSYYIGEKSKLEIENKEVNIFKLNESITTFNISYEIKNLTNNSFVSLYFKFEETPLLIKINYSNSNNENNLMSKNISESSYIYLNSEFLKCKNAKTTFNGHLSIIINNLDYSNTYMYLKIIEEESVSLLEENALNFGFITSKTTYQYYYTEVLDGEEGELMLHNKRNYGILHAKIVNKTDKENNSYNIYNISNYPIGNNSTDELEYDQHYLRLKFNNDYTSNCKNGCYLLITYEQKKSEGEFPLVGYEFTILSRTWNYSDYISSIVDISYNEYIISCFGKGASREHYYSIYIPEDVETIMIQLEGSYFEAFYEEGRKKINTLKEGLKTIGTQHNQNITILDNTNLNLSEKFVSFAFRPRDYYTSIISSYYFRVLYTKKNETKIEKKYLPIDSNFGNLCLPENDTSSEYYYCYFILKNNYNESKMNFTISSTNQNEYIQIIIKGITENNTENISESDYFNYIYDKNISDIDHFLIKFQFKNGEMKTIISSFCDRVNETYPHIYSAQMFFLNNYNKTHNFNLKNSFSANYQFISGTSGMPDNILTSPNIKGKLITFYIKDKYSFKAMTKTNEYIYYLQLMQKLQVEDFEELKQGKPSIQLIDFSFSSLYYYYKISNKDYINVNVNIKINEDYKSDIYNSNYTIEGYILNEDKVKRRLNGEFIEIPASYKGKYSDAYGIGFLQVNKKIMEKEKMDNQYLFIVLENKDYINQNHSNPSEYFLEILAKEYDEHNELYLPQNEYFIDTFDDAKDGIRNFNKYSIFNPKGDSIQPVIELSSQYKNINIDFEGVNICKKESSSTGFWSYTICESNNVTIYFKVISHDRKANYMLIYYLNETNDDYTFSLDENYTIKNKTQENTIDISIKFNGINVNNSEEEGIIFFINGTLYELKDKPDETINNTCFLNDRKIVGLTSKAYSIYDKTSNKSSEFTLIFRGIPLNDNNYFYDLRLQMVARILNNYIRDEFLSFALRINLTEIKEKNNDEGSDKPSWKAWGIPVIVIGSILIIVLIFIVVKFVRLQNKNTNLQNEMVSLAFSNDVQKNVLIKDRSVSVNESDYESTFI